MKAETEALWSERVEEWRESGKSAPDFAADKPYAGSTLQWAASRLKRGARRGRKRRVSAEGASVAREIPMAKVVRRSRRDTPIADVVIEIAGARIAVRQGFDVALLGEVVRALREGR